MVCALELLQIDNCAAKAEAASDITFCASSLCGHDG